MPVPSSLAPVVLQRAEEATTRWFRLATRGTTVEHVLDPDYWQHIAGRLLRTPNKGLGDEIRVLAEDGSFDVEVAVLAVDPRGLWAQVHLLREWKAAPGAAIEAPGRADKDGYSIEFGGAHKFRIINRAGEVVEKGFATEQAAVEGLRVIKAAKIEKAA